MSDGDAPFRHTRSSDLKRKPLTDMASRQPSRDHRNDQPNDASTTESSPKSSVASPGTKRKGLYPDLTPETSKSRKNKPEITPENNKDKKLYPNVHEDPGREGDTTDGRLDDSQDILHDGSHSDTNQSARKFSPSPKPQRRAKAGASRQDREDRIRINRVPATEPSGSDEGSGNFGILIVFGVIILLAAGLVMLYVPNPEVRPQLTTGEIFLKNFKEIKNSYPAQNQKFWKIIASQVKRVLSNDSTYPAVILLGTPEGHAALGTCFAKQVLNAVNDAAKMTGGVYIDTASLDQTSAAKTKFNLDENLKTIFDNSKGAIIDHVEKLPAQAALLLHGYCDGDNAPYKDVVLFLVLNTQLTVDHLNDRVVEKSLTHLWGTELGVDEMPALCSRIANNIVVLSPEEDETLAICT